MLLPSGLTLNLSYSVMIIHLEKQKSTLNFNICIYVTVKMPDINSLTFTVSRGRRNHTTFTVLAQFPYELNSQPIISLSGSCSTNLSVLFFYSSFDFECFYYEFIQSLREIREATVLLLLHNTIY